MSQKTKNIIDFNAFCIAGTNSGVGKTTITLGILRALHNRGFKVQPFKCGPDYIDTEFHNKAAFSNSYNLDTWMMGESEVNNTFQTVASTADCAVVEGVMGLFDGANTGSLIGSSAGVAKLLNLPIILVVNAKGMAQSIAAIVKGYHTLYDDINIAGVIANNVGSDRHGKMLANILASANLPPLVGYLHRNSDLKMSERHLGLTPPVEENKNSDWYDIIAENIEKHVNLDLILKLFKTDKFVFTVKSLPKICEEKKIRLGIAFDDAFHFYYQDNLDLLETKGFELVKFSPLEDSSIPNNIDALYIGGGFPEMFAQKLSSNRLMIRSIKSFAEDNGIIYAECGGYMYLSNQLIDIGGNKFKMCNIIPSIAKMANKLQKLGYRTINLKMNNLFGSKGTEFKGHEFHWSSMDFTATLNSAWQIKGTRDKKWHESGVNYKNVYASYIHVHFRSNPKIVDNLKEFIMNHKIKGKGL